MKKVRLIGSPNRTKTLIIGALSFILLFPFHAVSEESILFLSTQLTPLPEATMMRQVILKDFPQPVDFEPYDNRAIYKSRVLDLISKPGGLVVLGGLQEDFWGFFRAGALSSLDEMTSKLSDRTFIVRFPGRGAFGTESTFFIPWMRATYLMAANKRALDYLPKGANLKRLSYDELKAWAANMYLATGKARLGFPIGQTGLMHRFLQGYLYPSFTGSMTDGFEGPAAAVMWQYLRDLWQYVSPSSLILNRMDEALLNNEVWVGWDHSARLLKAFKDRPDEFVAFPAPVGPKGRGFILVLAGLGLPKGSSSDTAWMLIEYLTRPTVQVRTMLSVGFLPVVGIDDRVEIPKGLSALVQAAVDQQSSPEAIVNSIPLMAADVGRSLNLVYMVAFSQIILRGLSANAVLETQGKKLHEIRAKGGL